MNKRKKFRGKPTIKSVKRQFKYWRSTRKLRDPIPERLWRAAVELTKVYSLNQVSKELRLNHTALSEQVSKLKKEPSKNNFVELALKSGLLPEPEQRYEIEVTDGRGWKLKLCGNGVAELLLPAQRVWRGEF